jgi:NADH-quinone oxidoreductase subunit J
MTVELVLFFILAAVAVASAVGMLVSRNAVHSALFLVLNFGTVAVFFLLLGAPFIAMAQVTVYAGAIMVLFLFVIMLLGADRLRPRTDLAWQTPLAAILALVLVAEAGYILLGRAVGGAVAAELPAGFGGPLAIGTALFTDYLLPFEITSILLLVGMVGAIVLTRDDRRVRKPRVPGVRSQG